MTISSPEMKKSTQTLGWGDFKDPSDPSKGKYFPLHEGQLAVYNSNSRFTAAIAGTGGGKTVVGPLWIARQIENHRNKNPQKPFLGMIIAPTYKVLARATVPTLLETLKGTVLEGKWNTQQHLYTVPDLKTKDKYGNIIIKRGGRIWCQGADNPGGLEGGQFDFVWADEGGQLRLMVWVAIQGRTGARQAPILITTTPYIQTGTNNWLYTDFYTKYMEGDPNYFVKQWSSFLNPIYPREEYERAKAGMSSVLGAMRYDGVFGKVEGAVYPEFSRCLLQKSPSELNKLLKQPGQFFGGIDFGWNDPFCALCGFLDANDVLWIWFERYKSKVQTEIHAEYMPQIPSRTISWYAEHQPEMVMKLRKGGHKVRKAVKNLKAGINAVNARINTGRLKIFENRCKALVHEGEVYSYPEDEETTGGDKPLGGFDHAMDALRYLVMGIDRKRAY